MRNVHIRDVIRSAGKRRRQSIELSRLRSELVKLGTNIIKEELEVIPVFGGTRVIDIPRILPVNIDAYSDGEE
jgi:hypothetical protein